MRLNFPEEVPVGFHLELLVAAIILVITLAGGLFPIFLNATQTAQQILVCGEAFSGGVFLGAGFIHLLGDSQALFQQLGCGRYPLSFAICALSIFLLQVIEEGVTHCFQHRGSGKVGWIAYLLIILLSIHSILEGAALGVETTLAGFVLIFIAIISHKGAESFSLGVNMRKSRLVQVVMTRLMFLFSLMTPVGILLGSVLMHFVQGYKGQCIQAVFDAVAAGTFIYIAAFHAATHDCCDESITVSIFYRWFYFLCGLCLMAVVAIWC
ncbi:MAG TPA: hypothetical protein DIC51_05250 [Coxiellaceae bacterium]|nr:hypothetical protein [Coxiellaceae bacterium]